jgi:hypothetical protein
MEKVILSGFFDAIASDPRISITHIGIYAALTHYWQSNKKSNPIVAFSYEIMKIAKITGPRTYHKCIKDLDRYGYIRYEPSFNRNEGSRVYLY